MGAANDKTSLMENVVLVDEHDNEVGVMEKQEAHVQGALHRAISVFIFNSKNELLLQQRAGDKYHSALLWTNTCCSHPRQGEAVADAAVRRLQEEMGITCPLEKAFSFVYKADFDNGLTEHEYDHVFIGVSDSVPVPDSNEVASWKYISSAELKTSMADNPNEFTEWFRICIDNWQEQLFR